MLNHTYAKHSKLSDIDEGEWRIIKTKTSSLSNLNTRFAVTDDRILKMASVIKIETVLQRNSFFYNQLISVPVIGNAFRRMPLKLFENLKGKTIYLFKIPGAFLLVLLSFWVERFLRIMLNSFSLIILILMLLLFADHGPSNYTPTIGK